MEFNSNFIHFLHYFFSKFIYLCSHPLFLSIVALYTLILIYAPSCFLRIALSPVLNTTLIILIYLLKLGVNDVKESSFQGNVEKLEKEDNYLESRVIDNKDKRNETLSIDEGNMTLYSSLVQESRSMEQRFLDYLDKNQTHAEFKAKMDLELESYQTHAENKPSCGLELEYGQMHTQIEHDVGSENSIYVDDYHKWELLDTNSRESSQVDNEGEGRIEMGTKQVDTIMKILEWNIKAPLEIIYEAYEGEEDEEEENAESNENDIVSSIKHDMDCEKYPFLLMYYPESETDSSSDDDFPMKEKWETHESVFLKWEEEDDDREELIEISLDRNGKRSFDFCHAEEDNLIEIDIFTTRN